VRFYRSVSSLLAVITVGLGAAILVVTVASGGGSLGLVLGLLFLLAGAGRLYVAMRSR